MSDPQLRAARLRALATIVVTVALCGGGYLLCSSPVGLAGDACKSSRDCGGIRDECLQAPTGAYCTHSCNRDEDCDPGTHCDIPPWEKEKTTKAFCLHDTSHLGKN